MLYVNNTFSLNMLDNTTEATLKVHEIDVQTAKSLLQTQWVSCIGHQGTAEILTNILDIQIPFNRIPVKMKRGDIALIFQLMTRVEEGKILTRDELNSLPFKLLVVEVV